MSTPYKFRLASFSGRIKGMVYFQPPGYRQTLLMRITRNQDSIHWEVTPDLPTEDRDHEFGFSEVEPGKFREEFGAEISMGSCRYEKSFTVDGKVHTFKTSQDPQMVQDAIAFYHEAVAAR